MEEHAARVAPVASRIAALYASKTPFKVYRGATNSTRVVSFEKDKMVDVSHLRHVLGVNVQERTVLVEPNVPMDVLVRETLRYGLIPPVVMELPGITVGGGLQGGAGESSSYKWGTFNRIFNWYEMILADGTTVRASRTQHADLFWGAAGSYGSLGVVTLAEVQLIPAKQYVKLSYLPVSSFDQVVAELERQGKAGPDFVDGIMFAKDSGVVVVGTMVDASTAPEQTFTRATDNWFYLHAQTRAQSGKSFTEKVLMYDYLFRYDRGAFWMGRFAFERLHTPFNRFTRWLLDPLLHTRKMYEALQASGISQECIIQDLALPRRSAAAFMEYIDQAFGIYPLWLCPLLPEDKSRLLSSYIDTDMVVNVGVWGRYRGTYEQFVHANKELEAVVQELGGKKWLYAHAYYDEPAFWKIYDSKGWYGALRKKYNATTLPTVYDKVKVTQRYAVSAKRGIAVALLGRSGIRRD